ncbi:MAG TPA: universal stress protein [Candidatus Saccharimonadales bacterium]|nr:universal stress protein [Candidatus Saccharimonadales bacterium]
MKETIFESFETKPAALWKTILVPIDFSEGSKEAVKVAVCLAEQCSAKLTLLHVVQLSPADAIETGTAAYEAMDSARRSLDQMAEEIPAELVSQKVVCFSGEGVSRKIIQTAREISSDLIVLATHAYGFFKRALLGSTTASVNRDAPCEVLVVRQRQVCR